MIGLEFFVAWGLLYKGVAFQIVSRMATFLEHNIVTEGTGRKGRGRKGRGREGKGDGHFSRTQYSNFFFA